MKRRQKTSDRIDDRYADFVRHPRYGQSPNVTGLNPKEDHEAGTFFHWRYREDRIRNTAVVADPARQSPAAIPVTHYFDLKRQCRECKRYFIFFALEQKYWYETLGFSLDADCVLCIECRKKQQGLARQRERYEELSHVAEKTTDEKLEMVECCLALIDASLFGSKSMQRVQMLLNTIPAKASIRKQARFKSLVKRIQEIESRDQASCG